MNAYQSDNVKETDIGVYAYDRAIVDDLRIRFKDPRIHITPAESTFSLIGQISDDVIQMPVISITRTGWGLRGIKPQAMIFEGDLVKVSEDDEVSKLQAIPIRVNYEMNIWTVNRIENDAILREIIFYYTQHPTLEVKIPHKLDITHNFNIFFNDDVEDNSDINEHDNRGQFFRQTIDFYTDDAYLWKSKFHLPTVVSGIKCYIEDNYNKEVIEEEDIDFPTEDLINDNKKGGNN